LNEGFQAHFDLVQEYYPVSVFIKYIGCNYIEVRARLLYSFDVYKDV